MNLENDIRSAEVQEIMERMPAKFIRWGSSALLLLILILVIIASYVQYPDVIKGNAVLITEKPPATVTAKFSGVVENFFVKDKSPVNFNTPLLVVRGRTNYRNALWLDSLLSEDSLQDNVFNLQFWDMHQSMFEDFGELTSAFYSFYNSLREYYTLSQNKVTVLHALKQPVNKKINDKAWGLIVQRDKLKQSLIFWKEKYLLRAPISGTISLLNNWTVGQEIKPGDVVGIIVPACDSLTCKINIPVEGSSKVKVGQSVRIALSNYPESEFGYIDGKVLSISPIPVLVDKGYSYIVNASIKTPVITSSKKTIASMPEMQGTAEIVTENKTILNRLLENWLSYFKKR